MENGKRSSIHTCCQSNSILFSDDLSFFWYFAPPIEKRCHRRQLLMYFCYTSFPLAQILLIRVFKVPMNKKSVPITVGRLICLGTSLCKTLNCSFRSLSVSLQLSIFLHHADFCFCYENLNQLSQLAQFNFVDQAGKSSDFALKMSESPNTLSGIFVRTTLISRKRPKRFQKDFL